MAHQLHWFDEEAGILQVDIEGTATWDGFHNAIDRIIEILKATPHERVDIIFNSTTKPPAGNPIPHIQRAHRDLSQFEQMGLLVVVNASRSSELKVLKVLTDIVLKTAGIVIPQLRLTVNTHDEALQLIAAERADVANSVSQAILAKSAQHSRRS